MADVLRLFAKAGLLLPMTLCGWVTAFGRLIGKATGS